jgi:hypothetical protein
MSADKAIAPSVLDHYDAIGLMRADASLPQLQLISSISITRAIWLYVEQRRNQ